MSQRNIVDIMATVVAAATAEVLPTVMSNNLLAQAAMGLTPQQDISSIRFMYGHPVELVDVLKEYQQSPTAKYSVFPVVMLFTDPDEEHGLVGGYPMEVTLKMVIAHYTDPNYRATDRRTRNFDPILQPIYEAILQAISNSSELVYLPVRAIRHTKTDRYFWGKTGLYGNTANEFNDFIDAIEISNLKLKTNLTQIC